MKTGNLCLVSSPGKVQLIYPLNMQTTKNILLVRPANFGFNSQTESSNAFQNKSSDEPGLLQQKAFAEFDNFVKTLKDKGVTVFVFEDTILPQKPDAVFPNNWVSFHADGTVLLYPMHAPNRQFERRKDILDAMQKSFYIKTVLDLSHHEKENRFLEGTGSIIFDHNHKMAYACISPRSDRQLFLQVCNSLQYQAIPFYSHDENGMEIYHSNVMMCIGEKFAAICLDSITDKKERALVSDSLTKTGHQIIDISFEQMKNFAGNMLEIKTANNKNILALSQSAFNSLHPEQLNTIRQYCEPVPLSIKTIETIGGGSARCMIAEIFLPAL